MNWCRFEVNGRTIEGDRVTAISGTPFGEHKVTPDTHALTEVQLLVPVIPPNFYAAGINYPEHVTFAAEKAGT